MPPIPNEKEIIVLIWIPRHIGITHNEEVDILVKKI
jgi:hypothetical protein